MLGLASHEAHFSILREDVFGDKVQKCFRCGQEGHRAQDCTGQCVAPPPCCGCRQGAHARGGVTPRVRVYLCARRARKKRGEHGEHDGDVTKYKPLQFLQLAVLREYLAAEFEGLRPFVKFWDVERVIDDFVMICFFVGNDFLPHLPSLDIREGALDMLIGMYKRLLPRLSGYLTRDGEIDMAAAAAMLSEVGSVEQRIFEARRDEAEFSKRRAEDSKNRMTGHGAGGAPWLQGAGRGGAEAAALQQQQQQQQLAQQHMIMMHQQQLQQQQQQRQADMRAQELRLAEFAAGSRGAPAPAPAPGSGEDQNKSAAARLRAMMRASDSVVSPVVAAPPPPASAPSGAAAAEAVSCAPTPAAEEACAPAPASVVMETLPAAAALAASPIADGAVEPAPASSDPLAHSPVAMSESSSDSPLPDVEDAELKVAVRVMLHDKHAEQGKKVVDAVRLGDDGCVVIRAARRPCARVRTG